MFRARDLNRIPEMPPIEKNPLQAPKLPRRIRFWRFQWFGLPVIFAIPILALAGVFGVRTAVSETDGQGLALKVEYPERFRYGLSEPIRVELRNDSNRIMRDVRIAVNPDYLRKFSQVELPPEAVSANEIRLPQLSPGELRTVVLEIQAESYGRHKGSVSAGAGKEEFVRAELHTMVFP